MKPLMVLCRNHALVRQKLALLESLLPLAYRTEEPIRELTRSIEQCLECHCAQESFLAAVVRKAAKDERTRESLRHLRHEQKEQQRKHTLRKK
jgi:DNA-binding SARP family transcriptional activator